MHQTFFIIDALFQGNHGFRSADTINIVYFEDDVFGMCSIFCPNLTENIEFSGSDVRNGHIGYLVQSLQHKLGLMGFLKKNTHVSYKGLA